jgi:hypothetical protein
MRAKVTAEAASAMIGRRHRKGVFHLVGFDTQGKIAFRKKVSRRVLDGFE